MAERWIYFNLIFYIAINIGCYDKMTFSPASSQAVYFWVTGVEDSSGRGRASLLSAHPFRTGNA
ncbi:hypothetical protein O0882_07355 [Janthinobacterium sp. SUN073]|uniref:hypothetical protein n=1 Tax=Janthinobacterium sp. SUN073 TaxID=3004102 RepID=UPI0025AEFCA3|nr:hypothetical protein [Janthinobacterium sp. SUN073]MDN2696128.1 hypothetical protein [Janthinobacterium sp. SUN073]